MIKGFVFGIFLVILVAGFYIAHHLGVTKAVTIGEEDRPAYSILFKDHLGAYYGTSETITSVEQMVKLAGLDCERTFGQYLDDPQNIDEDRLHSRGGCISQKPYTQTPADLQHDDIPAQHYVIGHFSGSPAIGPWKVYSKAMHYIEEHRKTASGPVIEIYSLQDGQISTEYLFPVKATSN